MEDLQNGSFCVNSRKIELAPFITQLNSFELTHLMKHEKMARIFSTYRHEFCLQSIVLMGKKKEKFTAKDVIQLWKDTMRTSTSTPLVSLALSVYENCAEIEYFQKSLQAFSFYVITEYNAFCRLLLNNFNNRMNGRAYVYKKILLLFDFEKAAYNFAYDRVMFLQNYVFFLKLIKDMFKIEEISDDLYEAVKTACEMDQEVYGKKDTEDGLWVNEFRREIRDHQQGFKGHLEDYY